MIEVDAVLRGNRILPGKVKAKDLRDARRKLEKGLILRLKECSVLISRATCLYLFNKGEGFRGLLISDPERAHRQIARKAANFGREYRR